MTFGLRTRMQMHCACVLLARPQIDLVRSVGELFELDQGKRTMTLRTNQCLLLEESIMIMIVIMIM